MTRKDLGFRMGTGAFAFVVIAIVCGIGIVLTKQSMLSIEKFGLKFWRTDIWDPVSGEFGALPFIWGTLYSSVLALVIATPIAIGIAVFISELCPARLRQPLVFLTELLAAIPSIVYGLWGIFVLVPAVRAVESSFPDAVRELPLFSGPPLGLGMMAAALILAIMVIPFTSSVSREVLRSVPAAQREGAYAHGAQLARADHGGARRGDAGGRMTEMVKGSRSLVARKAVSSLFVAFCAGSALIALVPLGFILFFVVTQGIRSINLDFFLQMPKP